MNKGDWIQTYTGKQFYPLSPEIDKISIVDIAHALSMKCRYTGHCSDFYSVAEHSVVVSNFCLPQYALAGLMHDAAEAYLPDVSRPIKPYLTGFKQLEDSLLGEIFTRYNIIYPYPQNIKDIDTRACFSEGVFLMPDISCWKLQDPLPGFRPMSLSPTEAKVEFLERFFELYLNGI